MSSVPAGDSAAGILSRWIASNASALGDIAACVRDAHQLAQIPFEQRQSLSSPCLTPLRQTAAGVEALLSVDPTSLAGLLPAAVDAHLQVLVATAWLVDPFELRTLARMTPAQLARRFADVHAEHERRRTGSNVC